MKDLSYGIFTIFIAFVIFAIIKNVFFNANQLTKRIRYRFLFFSFLYFVLFVLGISVLVAMNDDWKLKMICLDISFFIMTIPLIYTSIRMESNDTSAYNKWFFSINMEKGGRGSRSEESTDMKVLYSILLIISIGPLAWMFWLLGGMKIEVKCAFILFFIFSFILTFGIVLSNAIKLGDLIRKNLLYNYLWEMAQNGNFKNANQLDKAKTQMSGIFKELFPSETLYKENKDKNKEIIKWINDLKIGANND